MSHPIQISNHEAMTKILTEIKHLAASIASDPSTSTNPPEYLKSSKLENMVSKEVEVIEELIHRIDVLGGSIEVLSKRHHMDQHNSFIRAFNSTASTRNDLVLKAPVDIEGNKLANFPKFRQGFNILMTDQLNNMLQALGKESTIGWTNGERSRLQLAVMIETGCVVDERTGGGPRG